MYRCNYQSGADGITMTNLAEEREDSWLRLVGSFKIWVSFAKDPYKRDLYSAKETCTFKEPTNRSHPIVCDGTDW